MMNWPPSSVITDYVVHCWINGSSAHTLTNKIEIVSFLTSDYRIDNCTRNWIYDWNIGATTVSEESSI